MSMNATAVKRPSSPHNGSVSRRNRDLLNPTDHFVDRHLGPRRSDLADMLSLLGLSSLDELVDQALPQAIRLDGRLNLEPPRSESEILAELRALAAMNQTHRSFIGMGYYDCIMPPVILRNIFENPGWYTQYTPYQAEISQGRLEALLNFQTMVTDLTGLEIANASMLDEGTAAAEAMTLCQRSMPRKSKANTFFVSELVHPQTIAIVQTRARPLGINVVVGDHAAYDFSQETFGVLVQYPATTGDILNYAPFAQKAHDHGALVVAATDLLALALLAPPGEWGADVAVGSSQRFGMPMGYGGPHAAFMATTDKLKRQMPGRLIGVSIDAEGNPGMRLALQAREQHIRREKATSNICTAQVLLAIIASMYAVYHGPQGIRKIAERVRLLTAVLGKGLQQMGYTINDTPVFDTLKVTGGPRAQAEIREAALAQEINLRYYEDGGLGISLDEITLVSDLTKLFAIFGGSAGQLDIEALADEAELAYAAPIQRTSDYLTHPTFNSYHSETEMM
ncbi:MAG: glycine dehydrogenase, partial [Anaerolineae bacterium]